MRLKRREFLKAGAAAGAVAAATSTAAAGMPVLNSLAVAAPGGPQLMPGEWIATTCQGCTTWCPVEVFVQNGRAVKVRGNPRAKQNDGTCCPRGHMGLQQLYDPDRVKVPMKRTNPKKGRGEDPGFVPVSWDEALDTVAEKILELRNNGESHKYLLMRGRYTYMRDVIYDAMTKIIGSPNNISHSAICAEAEKFGPFFTAGNWGYRDHDLSKAKFVLIWGCDPLNSNRMVPAAIRRFSNALDNGRIVVVDPKLQTSAAKAHEWMPIRPGQDGALAVALAHVLLTEGLWFREFVGDFKEGKNLFVAGQEVDEAAFNEVHTNGLVKWWNLELKDRTPAWAAKLTGLKADRIVALARGLAAAAPNAIVWLGPGACMHIRGSYAAMAIHALTGLLGSIDNEGGVLAGGKVPVRKMPKVDAYLDDVAKAGKGNKKIDQRGYLEFPSLKKGKPGGGVVTGNVAKAMLDEDPYDIKMAIGYMNNFTYSCTGAQQWEEAMAKLPFYVHLTTHASEMTQFADIVLPTTMSQFEKWGWIKSKANRYAYASLLRPVVEPLWDVRTDETEIPWLIAEKLAAKGFPNLLDFLKNEYKDPETGESAKSAEEFNEIGVKWYTQDIWSGKKETAGDQFAGWAAFRDAGVWHDDPYPYKKRWGKFKTATKKFEFYSETLKASLKKHAEKHGTTIDAVMKACKYEARGELAFLPHYERVYRYGDRKNFPLSFIDYKSRLNREGRSPNSSWYYEFLKLDAGNESGKDLLQINPKDAKRFGIGDGDTVKVTTKAGSWTMTAKLWEGVSPGTVTKVYGMGHWAYGRLASKDYKKALARGVNNNELMPVEFDRLSGSTARNGGFVGVRVEKA